MNQITPFEFQGQQVRVIVLDGEPWWVAKDVCDHLEMYWDGSRTITHVPQQWRGSTLVPTLRGDQEMAILSEPGLYFFLARSDKPKALPFQMWISAEVLPSIRKHGMYATDALLDDPEHLLKVTRRLVEERQARLAAEAQVQLLAPKAEFHDRVAEATNCQSIRDVSKVLGTGQNRMFDWLRGQRILMADNRPYQEYLDAGYFRVIEQTWTDRHGEEHLTTKSLVTGKGLTWLQKRFHGTGKVVAMQ